MELLTHIHTLVHQQQFHRKQQHGTAAEAKFFQRQKKITKKEDKEFF